jgi:hypothetical protein
MIKGKGECPHGLVHTKQGIGHLSHLKLHPHPIPVLRRHVSPNPLLGLRTLKGGGFGLTEVMIHVELVEKDDVLLRSEIAGFVIFVFAYFQVVFMKLPTFPNPHQLMLCTSG